MNLAAIEDMNRKFPHAELCFVESGGDNLAATFSPELADLTIYVIDGAFKLEGWHYAVECRWREKLADIRELDGLKGQVDRSGKQTMGLFLSINGWSENVPTLLEQNPDKSIILFNGYDLRCVLNRQADLTEFLLAKVARLNLHSDPAYGMQAFLEQVV